MILQLYYTDHSPKCHALLPYIPDWVQKIDAYKSEYDPPHVPFWRIIDDTNKEVATLESMDFNEVKVWFKSLNKHVILNNPYATDEEVAVHKKILYF